jgi:hypothetical protein
MRNIVLFCIHFFPPSLILCQQGPAVTTGPVTSTDSGKHHGNFFSLNLTRIILDMQFAKFLIRCEYNEKLDGL